MSSHTAWRRLVFVSLLFQAACGVLLGLSLLLFGIFALPAGVPLGLTTLVTAVAVMIAAAGVARGSKWARLATLIFEAFLIAGGLLSLVVKPDLLALVTSVLLPGAILWALAYRWRCDEKGLELPAPELRS